MLRHLCVSYVRIKKFQKQDYQSSRLKFFSCEELCPINEGPKLPDAGNGFEENFAVSGSPLKKIEKFFKKLVGSDYIHYYIIKNILVICFKTDQHF